MKKTIIIILIFMSLISTAKLFAYEPVSLQVQNATSFLTPRPGSNRTSTTLTLTQLNNFRSTVQNFLNTASSRMYDVEVETLQLRLNEITNELSGVNSTTFNANYAHFYSLYEDLFDIYGQAIESRPIDGRGMWHRPFERTLDEVRITLAEMQDLGINMLYVETFWLGRLIYESSIPDTFQHGFTRVNGYGQYGTNLLKAFVEEGKQYGIEVHAWVENFFVGFGSSYLDSPILVARPDFASYNYDYSIPQRSEVNYLFMDPANPEVRRYLKNIYIEIVTTTDVASIHLDYIRYPVARNVTSTNPQNNLDTGYSDYAEMIFKAKHNLTGDLRTLVVQNVNIANLWKQFKTDVISNFVAGVYYDVKKANSNVTLSTAIFGNVQNAINEKMQDWDSWIQDGYVEIITPMSYYQSSLTVGNETKNLTNLVGKNAFSYAGLAPTYMGFNAYLNTTQVQASLHNGAQGTAFFASQFYMFYRNDYQQFNAKDYALSVQSVIRDGVFRKDAIVPHAKPSLLREVQFDLILDKASRIYVERGVMTFGQYELLVDKFEQLNEYSLEDEQSLRDFLADLKSLQTSTYAQTPANLRINEDIQYLIKILEIRLERYELDAAIDLTLNPDPDFSDDAIMLDAPLNLVVVGRHLSWSHVTNALRYEVSATTNSKTETFFVQGANFDLLNLQMGTYSFRIRAIGDGFFHLNSTFSTSLEHNVEAVLLESPTNLRVENGIVRFNAVSLAQGYEVIINQTEFFTASNQLDLRSFGLPAGIYMISVRALGNDGAIIDSSFSESYTYVIAKELSETEQVLHEMIRDELKTFIFYWLNRG